MIIEPEKFDFNSFFTDGKRIDDLAKWIDNNVYQSELTFRTKSVGDIAISSNELYAGDPFESDPVPFNKKVTNGIFPVDISYFQFDQNGTIVERICFARITFSNEKVNCWESASINKEAKGNNEEAEAFFVNSGLACFTDIETMRSFAGKIKDENYKTEFLKELETDPPTGIETAHHRINEKQNIAAFKSGWGDGAYPAFWGIDAKGTIASLVIHFDIIVI